jgi:hypothetical protein
LACLLLLPLPAHAQFDARKPDAVGIILMPLLADREEDDSVAFLLEEFLAPRIGRRLRRPVHMSREITPAMAGTPASCLRDSDCVRLLGGQFNSSLVADALVLRKGGDLELRVDWYTTGNGLKVGRESVVFAPGKEDAVIDAFEGWVDKLFDASLRVHPETRSDEGSMISKDDAARVDEYKAAREKKVSSRRSDFGEDRPERDDDRDAADLRREAEDDPEPEPTHDRRSDALRVDEADHDELEDEPEPPPRRESTQRESTSREADSDPEPARSREAPRSEPARPRETTRREDHDDEPALTEDEEALDEPSRREDDGDLDLDASRDSGRSVSTYMDAQQAGLGQREYARFERTGETMDTYLGHRWAFGRRVHVTASAFYGLGGLTRRYASLIFVRAGNVKTDEYKWESLGMSWLNPGFQIGVGFAPLDLLEIALDIGLMYGKQDLRREYDSHDVGTNIPATPESAATAHVIGDLKARFFILPKRRVKIAASVGPSVIVLAGYKIQGEPPLDYASRPPAVVVGITGGAGAVISLSPFVALSLELSGSVYVAQGAAKYEEHQLFSGVTEPYLPAADKQPPLPSTPAMGRFTVAPMFFF